MLHACVHRAQFSLSNMASHLFLGFLIIERHGVWKKKRLFGPLCWVPGMLRLSFCMVQCLFCDHDQASQKQYAWDSITNQLKHINNWELYWSIVLLGGAEVLANSLEVTLYHVHGLRKSPDIILYCFDGYIGILLPFRGWLSFCLWLFSLFAR